MKSRKTRLLRGMLLALLLTSPWVLASCGSESSGEGVPEVEVRDPNQPGLFEIAPNRYEAVIVAFEGGFDPHELTVPVGAEVLFRVRSADLVHGFLIEGTGIEFEVDPLEPIEASHTFTEAGEYPLMCHVYCGGGHPAMLGKVIVQ